MCLFRTLLALSLLPATAAMARTIPMDGDGQYTVPTEGRPDLADFATFNLNDYQVRNAGGGRARIEYRLPADLTGGVSPSVSLTESAPGSLRFLGQNGEATCSGDDFDEMRCDYRFFNLANAGVSRQQSVAYVNAKYALDPLKRDKLGEVVLRFLAEPHGIAELDGGSCDECKLGNGEWSVRYQNPQGQWINNVHMSIDRYEGFYWVNGSTGVLEDLYYEDGRLKGYWRMGGSRGWFVFHFNGNQFQGSWGSGGEIGHDRRGQWNGQRR